jgi:glutathione S-transferase
MLTIHHLGISQSERIVWLCEELGVPYELKKYDRDPQTRLAPAEYKALHPIGTAPIITDGDLVLPESGAIIEYINTKYGHGKLALKPDHPNYADYVFWFHFANGSMMPNMMMALIVNLSGANTGGNPIMESLLGRSQKGFAYMEARLSKVPYFAGETFTAADVIMLFPLTTMRAFAPFDLGAYPRIKAYLKRIGERPAYQRAMKKGDPDMPPVLA